MWYVITFIGCLLGLVMSQNASLIITPTSSTVPSTISKPLPDGWNDFCVQVKEGVDSFPDNTLYFNCNVDSNSSDIWRLDVLRYWMTFSDKKYFFNLRCHDAASISIPWPIKAKNLVGVHATNCVIKDFFADFGNTPLFESPDELRTLRLRHCNIFIDLMSFVQYMMNVDTMPKDFNCGNEDTLEDIVMSNITYVFDQDQIQEIMTNMNSSGNGSDPVDTIIQTGSTFIEKTRNIEHNCDFKKLRLIDQSTSVGKSRFFAPILTERSLFYELRVYNLSRTGMIEIDNHFINWGRFFPKLRMLDLSNNKISEIRMERVWDKPLLHINLTNNDIQTLSTSTIQLLVSLPNVFFDIRGNPFHCECSPDMDKFIKLIKDDDLWATRKYVRYQYIRDLTCVNPASLEGRTFRSIEFDEECKTASVSVVTVVCFTVVILILLVIIIVMAKFRREIQILTYTRFHIVIPCQPTETYQDKIYDAFVSYSNSDEIWVTKTFTSLEDIDVGWGTGKFRFCLHQRDFIAGKTIFDNVIQSVESSRHTVIVLSKSFIQSQWCLYEFQEAFQQSILERKRHLVVVLLEDIPEEELPKDLRRCLKTFTYIHRDDAIFSDRLIYALSFKGKQDVARKGKIKDVIDKKEILTEDTSNKNKLGYVNEVCSSDNSDLQLNDFGPTDSCIDKATTLSGGREIESSSVDIIKSKAIHKPSNNSHLNISFEKNTTSNSCCSLNSECNSCQGNQRFCESNDTTSNTFRMSDDVFHKQQSVHSSTQENRNETKQRRTEKNRDMAAMEYYRTISGYDDIEAIYDDVVKNRIDSAISSVSEHTLCDAITNRDSNMTTDSGVWTTEIAPEPLSSVDNEKPTHSKLARNNDIQQELSY